MSVAGTEYSVGMGADRAVLLEPGSAGSHDDVLAITDALRGLHEEHRIDRILEKFQDFDPGDRRFDIILLHASVNHLDEETCLRLPGARWAKDRYLTIFLKISRRGDDALSYPLISGRRWRSPLSEVLFLLDPERKQFEA
jgi:hypothetical protein